MALFVQKFGGTSVGSIERMHAVAQIVNATLQQGHDVVVVVSAMSGETDHLLSLINDVGENYNREADAILATGEQRSAAMMAMILQQAGISSQSLTAAQCGIYGSGTHGRGVIANVESAALKKLLNKKIVPVVTGFQAVNNNGDILTLGRGGSDTTAVALAAALQAEECQIFTDVKGVYSTDPRVVPSAHLLKQISMFELGAMSSAGAKVMQRRALDCAINNRVSLRILSSFELDDLINSDDFSKVGTFVCCNDGDETVERPIVKGISFDVDQVMLSLKVDPGYAGLFAVILGQMSEKGLLIDLIQQDIMGEKACLQFVLGKCDYQAAESLIKHCQQGSESLELSVKLRVGKVSLVGLSIGVVGSIAASMLQQVSECGITDYKFVAAEHRFTVLIDSSNVEKLTAQLHDKFIIKQPVDEEISI